jgi:hypothetical protein
LDFQQIWDVCLVIQSHTGQDLLLFLFWGFGSLILPTICFKGLAGKSSQIYLVCHAYIVLLFVAMVSRKFMFKMMVKALLTAFLSYISFSPLFFAMSSCSIVQGNGQLADICPMLVLAPISLEHDHL